MAYRVFTNTRIVGEHRSDRLDIHYDETPPNPRLALSQGLAYRHYDLIVLGGLSQATYCFLLLKRMGIIKAKVVVLDPIFVTPEPGLVPRVKGLFMNGADAYFLYSRNNTGIERAFGIQPRRFVYIPFKVNNLDTIQERFENRESLGYVFSGGKSRRDYVTLIEAAKLLPEIPFKVVCPDEYRLRVNHCAIYRGELPENVEIIRDNGTYVEFLDVMSQSELVALPTTPENIAPAGISVYLCAMALRRPVVISKGPAVDDILTDELAVVVEPGDVAQLAEAVRTLYFDDRRKAALARAGYRYAMALGDEENLFESIERAAIELMEGGPARVT